MNFPVQPEQASNFAVQYDTLFFIITALTVLFTGLVFALCLGLIIKYKRGNGKPEDRRNPMHHNIFIELTSSGVSLVLGMVIFVWGAKMYIEMRQPPKNAMEIFVIGKRWMWHAQHDNGVRENNELHVPVGTPVKLTMISQDVIHSFYIPQFRVQFMVVPGRYTNMWFTPTKPGRFNLFCAMHCGTQHSEMGGYVYALEPAEFSKWKENGGNRFKPKPDIPALAGKQLYEDFMCSSCHGEKDGKRAPSLNGLVGRKRDFTDGSSMVADMDYIRQSLLAPDAKIVKGYRQMMQPYNFTEEQIIELIEYMKTLGSPVTPMAATPSATTVATGATR